MDGPGKPTPSSGNSVQQTDSKKQKYGSHNSKKRKVWKEKNTTHTHPKAENHTTFRNTGNEK